MNSKLEEKENRNKITLYDLLNIQGININIYVIIGLLKSGSYYFNELLISQLNGYNTMDYYYTDINNHNVQNIYEIKNIINTKPSIKNTLYIPNASLNITAFDLKDIAYSSKNDTFKYICLNNNGIPFNKNLIDYDGHIENVKNIVINFNDTSIHDIHNIFKTMYVNVYDTTKIKYIFIIDDIKTIFYKRVKTILYYFLALTLNNNSSKLYYKLLELQQAIRQNILKKFTYSYNNPKKLFKLIKTKITLNALQTIYDIIKNRELYVPIIENSLENNNIFDSIHELMISSNLIEIYRQNITYYYTERTNNDYTFTLPYTYDIYDNKELFNIIKYFKTFFNSININYNLVVDNICFALNIYKEQYTYYYTIPKIIIENTDYQIELNNSINISNISNNNIKTYFKNNINIFNKKIKNYKSNNSKRINI